MTAATSPELNCSSTVGSHRYKSWIVTLFDIFPMEKTTLLDAYLSGPGILRDRVALQSSGEGIWLDLELDLWRALATKVRAWGLDSLQECR